MPSSASSWNSALKDVPDGSLPSRSQMCRPRPAKAMVNANSLLMLWMEKRVSLSPQPVVSPSSSCTATPKCDGSTLASAGM